MLQKALLTHGHNTAYRLLYKLELGQSVLTIDRKQLSAQDLNKPKLT